MARSVGDELMTRYVIAFETAGLLLTVALVGAIAIAHREEAEPEPSRGAAATASESAGASRRRRGARAGGCAIVAGSTRCSLISRPRFAPAVRASCPVDGRRLV